MGAACGPGRTNEFGYARIADQRHVVSEAQGEVVGGKLYTFGGFDSTKPCCVPTDRAWVYTNGVGWSPLRPMPTKGVTHAGMATDGTDIYFAGGYVTNAAGTGQVFGTRAAWRYDVSSDTYLRLPDLPVELAGGQLEVVGRSLYHFGGTNKARSADLTDHWALDLSNPSATWQRRDSLANGRHHMGSAVLGGRIYAVGGQKRHDTNLVTQNTLEVYDPGTNQWTTRAPLPTARGHISSATFVLDGRLVVAGGEVAHGSQVATVSAYDPVSNSWTGLSPLPSAKASGVAVPSGEGFLFVTGGWRGGWRATPST